MEIVFKNEEHRTFYEAHVIEACAQRDPYYKALFYTLGLIGDTRRNIKSLYDSKEHCIKLDGLRGGWHTSDSLRVCRLAFNLFNGYTGSGKAAAMFTPYELFDTELMEYMVEAVRIRYEGYSCLEG